MWEKLGQEHLDVLIIGGGINGAGIARDAQRRGLRAALVEMNDLASGTSSASSKLVHGGIRYLEQLEFSLVFESVSERRILMDIAPHLVNPLGFLFPVYKTSRRALTTVSAGMWLYEGLSLFRVPKRHKTLKRDEVKKAEPALDVSNMKGAPLYYDCSTDDARLTIESAIDAAESGAVIASWVKATKFLHNEQGRVTGIVAQNVRTGETKEVHAHTIVNATGPWTDRVLALDHGGDPSDLLRPTKGVHIVVSNEKLPVNNAVVCFHPSDGRVLFAIPWGEQTYLGTTDTDYIGDPGEVCATLDDVDYLIDVSNHHFPEFLISRDDVISTWAGLRPLIRPVNQNNVDESAVSREHQILVGKDGVITIAGGKLTTYRKMSKEVVDTAVKLLRLSNQLPSKPLVDAHTDRAPLPGARDWPANDDHQQVADMILDQSNNLISPKSAKLLANTYGMRGLMIAKMIVERPVLATPIIEGRAEVMAQIDHGVLNEFAASVTDVMERRTQIFYRDSDQGLGAAEKVGARMAELLGWDDTTRAAMVKEYHDVVARSRAWQNEI